MPKKSKVTQPSYERPAQFPVYQTQPLSLDERNIFRDIVASPVFKKVLRNAYAKKPSSVVLPAPGQPLNAEVMRQMDSTRLARIQGWELFEAALLQQLDPPITKNFQMPTETFPITEPENT